MIFSNNMQPFDYPQEEQRTPCNNNIYVLFK